MEKEHTSVRLKKIMSDRNLRQIDILELCKPYCQKYNIKLGRNDLSQYVSGKVEPGQKKLTVLGMALGVNEAWLMGFDVPMRRDDYEDQNIITFEAKSEAAIKFLEAGGYVVSFSDNPKDDISTIIDSKHEPVSCMHEYELVNKYDSLRQRNMLTAESLAKIDLVALDKYKAARKEYARLWNTEFFETKILSAFSQLNDDNKKKSIAYTENLLSNQQMEEELIVNAANAIEGSTPKDEQFDEDIMDDENF